MFPSTDKATEPVATVADVHTAPPQRGQEGIAMHMGVGNVDFAVLAVPSPAGDGRGTVFVGPVGPQLRTRTPMVSVGAT